MGSYLGSEPRRRLEKSSEVGHGEAMPARVVAPRRAQPCRVLWEAAQSGPESWGRDPHLPPPVSPGRAPSASCPQQAEPPGRGPVGREHPRQEGRPSGGRGSIRWTFRQHTLDIQDDLLNDHMTE